MSRSFRIVIDAYLAIVRTAYVMTIQGVLNQNKN